MDIFTFLVLPTLMMIFLWRAVSDRERDRRLIWVGFYTFAQVVFFFLLT